jgi:hypothetical protein
MIISGFLVIGSGIVELLIARELKKDTLNPALFSWRKKANAVFTPMAEKVACSMPDFTILPIVLKQSSPG